MEELLAKMAGLLQDIYDEGHGGEFRPSIQEVLVKYNAAQQTFAPDVCHGTADGRHLFQNDNNGRYCFACGTRR